MTGLAQMLKVAMQAIDRAEKISLKYFKQRPKVETKSDNSPVTIADHESEIAIIDTIRKQFPSHGFYGEETGDNRKEKEFVWLIDPIDGTANFIRQVPLWGNLLALQYQGEVVLGISNVPLMNERMWATKGKGAYLNGKRAHVSNIKKLGAAIVSYAKFFKCRHDKLELALLKLLEQTRRQRAFGDVWPYHLLASGRLDIVLEVGIKPYDVAPFACILPEAGGEASDLSGNPFSLDIGAFIGSNGHLHKIALQLLKSNGRSR